MDHRSEYFSRLLEYEREWHRQTKVLLMQTQNTSNAWERSFHMARNEAQSYRAKLSVAESRSQDLSRENVRLSLVIRHLVRELSP